MRTKFFGKVGGESYTNISNIKPYLADVRKAGGDLVADNLKLVISIAKKYEFAMPIEDLIQEGNIGLIKAAETYDETLGAFSTHATPIIRTHMLQAIEVNQLVRVPHYCYKGSAINDSLDECIGNDGDSADKKSDFVIGDMGVNENLDTLAVVLGSLLDKLSDKERKVVTMYYGLGNDIPMGYQTIALEIGYSDERVRQIHVGAMAKLKKFAKNLDK